MKTNIPLPEIPARPCPNCGGELRKRLIPAGANSEGYVTSEVTECIGSQVLVNKKGGCGLLKIFFKEKGQ